MAQEAWERAEEQERQRPEVIARLAGFVFLQPSVHAATPTACGGGPAPSGAIRKSMRPLTVTSTGRPRAIQNTRRAQEHHQMFFDIFAIFVRNSRL
eukprot:COSAG06_NODE_2385_length_6974_cov_3.851491_3_plen_96_part_00